MKHVAWKSVWNSVHIGRLVVVASLGIAWAGAASVCAEQPPTEQPPTEQPPTAKIAPADDRPMSFWMEKKLDHSQTLLRALATSDFEALQSNARQMQLLNRVEGFVRSRNPAYRQQLHTFERVTGELERQAKRENIEGATLAFNQLTVSCVRCHETLRAMEQGPTTNPPTDAGGDPR